MFFVRSLLFILLISGAPLFAIEGEVGAEFWEDEEAQLDVYDPLEKVNRAVFAFNDFLYLHGIRQVVKGWRIVVPKFGRRAIGRFFNNLAFPIRFVNSTLQFKGRGAGRELLRFTVNSSFGLGGLADPALRWFHVSPSNEDFGQSLGKLRIGNGPYLMLPFLGPSNVRDFCGSFIDGPFDLKYYLLPHNEDWRWGARGLSLINSTAEKAPLLDSARKDALDLYAYIRDGYTQQRQYQVEN